MAAQLSNSISSSLHLPATVIDASVGDTVIVPGGNLLTDQYQREGGDLVLEGDNGSRIVISGYFDRPHPPLLSTPGGAVISPELAQSLAGPLAPGQFVQAGGGNGAQPIGTVAISSGVVHVRHADGTRETLEVGEAIYQGDLIETAADGKVGVTFADQSSFSLGPKGRMVMDELVFDADAHVGMSTVSVVKGAYSFVSGQIAKAGPNAMTIKTPVMTIGVRGTSGAGVSGGEGEGNLFSLLQDPSGTVGEITLTNAGGSQVINQANFSVSVSSYTQSPPPPVYYTAQQIQGSYGEAISANPQQPQASTAPAPTQTTPTETTPTETPTTPSTESSLTPPPVSTNTAPVVEPVPPIPVLPVTVPPVPPVTQQGPVTETRRTDEVVTTTPVTVDTTIYGTAGNDHSLNGTDGADVIRALAGDDTINAGSGNDTIYDGAGNDIVTGGDGDDVFVKGDGRDTIHGGAGTDTLSFTERTAGIVISMTVGEAETVSEVPDTLAVFDGIDIIKGTSYADYMNGSGGNDTFFGGGGNDDLRGGAGADRLDGDAGVDLLHGDEGDDILNGGAGNDTIFSGAGIDTIDGGDGLLDTFDGGMATQGIILSLALSKVTNDGFGNADASITGIERVVGSNYDDTITGSAGGDILEGGSGTNTLYGGDGADSLIGGSDTDTLYGGNGDDFLEGGGASGSDYLYGEAGNDTIFAQACGSMGIYDGGDGLDTISFQYTTAMTIDLTGGSANGNGQSYIISNFENVQGSTENDIITGSAQANTLNGGAGSDTLSLGNQDGVADYVVFSGGSGGTTLEKVQSLGTDTVNDFVSAIDKIVLSDATFGLGTSGQLDGTNYFESATAMTSGAVNYGGSGGSGLIVIGAATGGDGVEVWYTTDTSAASSANSYQISTISNVDTETIAATDFAKAS